MATRTYVSIGLWCISNSTSIPLSPHHSRQTPHHRPTHAASPHILPSPSHPHLPPPPLPPPHSVYTNSGFSRSVRSNHSWFSKRT